MNKYLSAALLMILLFASFNHAEVKKNVIRIAVISDLNAAYGSLDYSPDVPAVIAGLVRMKPDMVLCGGDMVAGQKASLTEENIRGMWRSFKQTVLDPLNTGGIPFGFTVGNHDASPTFQTDRRLARQFWQANARLTGLNFADSAHYPFYFSYVKENIFFISWDAAGAKVPPEVFGWMEKQLNTRKARKARLRIVIGHLPLYAIVEAKNKPGEVNADPAAALAFFKSQGVDLYISGHQHAYYPAQKEGMKLLHLGCIGDGPRPLLGSAVPARKAYTLIEIPRSNPEKFSLTTFDPSGAIIDLAGLPDSVKGFNGTVKKWTD